MSEIITIAGQKFKPITNSTMRHDIWTQGQLERAGLSRVNLEAGETPEEFAMRVLRQAAMNSDIFLLLGGLIMPADVEPLKWTVEMAHETGEFLGNVTEPLDKAMVQAQINAALTTFFATGLCSLMTSQRSLQQTREKPNTETGETLTMQDGARSSGDSPATITTKRKRSWIGRFARLCWRFLT
jgi:hypothetical protein